jgi:hypothetical protein
LQPTAGLEHDWYTGLYRQLAPNDIQVAAPEAEVGAEKLIKIIEELYRQPLMIMKEASGRWMTLRLNEKSGKNEPDAVFRIGAMTEY